MLERLNQSGLQRGSLLLIFSQSVNIMNIINPLQPENPDKVLGNNMESTVWCLQCV